MDSTTKKVLIGSGVVTGLGLLGYVFLKPAHAGGLVPTPKPDDVKPTPDPVKPAPPPVTTKPKETPPTPTPLPATYTVKAGDTPASIASRLGISETMLFAANPALDVSGFFHDMNSFTSKTDFGPGVPPVGTTYTPTWQAQHGTLYPVFRASQKSADGSIYFAFMNPDGLPLPMKNPGFGRIYSGDGGLKLVGPWYVGLVLNTSPMSSGSSVPSGASGSTAGGASGAGGTVGG